jgi:hypothetical protein
MRKCKVVARFKTLRRKRGEGCRLVKRFTAEPQSTQRKRAIGLRSCSPATLLQVSPIEESAVEAKVHDLKPIARKRREER